MDIFNLTDLTLEELSIVDRPANQGAMVTMFKRDNQSNVDKEQDMTVDNEAVKALKDRNEVLQKALIDNGFVITAEGVTKSDVKIDYIEVDGDKVNKADLPESVVKALEDAKVEKAALAIEKADIALTKKAEESFPNLDVGHAKTLLKAASALEDDKEFMAFLASMDALFGKSMEEIGKSAKDGDMSSATDTLEAKIKEVMTAKGLTGPVGRANAYKEIASTKDGASLITKASKE